MYSAKSDIGKIKVNLPKIRRKLMFAESEALNQTANQAAKAQRAQAQVTFDRPTTFLLNGIFRPTGSLGFVGIFSRYNTLRAELIPGAPRGNFKDPGRRINAVVRMQTLGGTRTPPKRALPVPTNKARLNKFGNLSRNHIKNLLAKPNHVQLGEREGLPPGIYRRAPGGRLVMLVAWEPYAGYRPLFNYHKIAVGVFKNNFDKHFARAFKAEMANLK